MLMAKLLEKDTLIAKLQAELATQETKTNLLIKNMAFEVELKMRGQVEEAFEKGFKSCKSQLEALKDLTRSFSI